MNRSRQRGVTLIEVLVAVLITATGVLGAATMQLNAVKFNQISTTRSIAVFLANDISDRMRANRADALVGRYDLGMNNDAPTGSAIYQIDVQDWLHEVALRLPAGDASIERDNANFIISIQWDESRLSKTREISAGDNQIFVFQTSL
ncbi:MAG: type IV pilus assembly protein PilV [Zhongshania sp.]|jgi:type IV pilus assembly protein PilV